MKNDNTSKLTHTIEPKKNEDAQREQFKLAITGMSIISQKGDTLDDFTDMAFEGIKVIQPCSSRYHDHDTAETPQNNMDDHAHTIRRLIRALQNAGFSISRWKATTIGLLLCEDHLQVQNIQKALQLTGPGLQINEGESLARIFNQAHKWLAEDTARAVLIGTMNNALLLQSEIVAREENRVIYAIIDAIESNSNKQKTEISTAGSCNEALKQANLTADSIGYLELTNQNLDAPDGHEFTGLAQIFRANGFGLNCAAGSLQIDNGHNKISHSISRLIKTALCLYTRQIPGMPEWKKPEQPDLWKDAPFYITTESRTWFLNAAQAKRVAAVNIIDAENKSTHVILSEDRSHENPDRVSGNNRLHLIPFAIDTIEDITGRLQLLRMEINNEAPISLTASNAFDAFTAHQNAKIKVALLCHNHQELLSEIDHAERSLADRLVNNREWQTPAGSYATPAPVGKGGKIAFVYPGAFNSYLGIGRELFRLFPRLHADILQLTSDPGLILRERLLYPRSQHALSSEQKIALEKQLMSNAIAMLTSGSAISFLLTGILKKIFGIQPDMAFGYSLGENSMLFASGVWNNGDEVNAHLERSNLFHTRLAGPMNAVREFWQLPSNNNGDNADELWRNYVVMESAENIRLALQAEDRVYLTHINTPRQAVIGGEKEACQRVIHKLGDPMHLEAPFNYALHCDAMRSEEKELSALHSWPVQQDPQIPLYTAANYRPLKLEQEYISISLGKMLCNPIDFPKLVNTVYEDGARVFIEVGAGSNCARWIDDTLKNRSHLALSTNRQSVDDHTSIMRLLAKLICHEVPLDLEPIFA